jgi:hypothetical protein
MRNIRDEILAADPSKPVPYHRGAALKGAEPEKLLAVRKLYDEGEIELTMRRVNVLTFEYRAHKLSKPVKRPVEQTFRFAGII